MPKRAGHPCAAPGINKVRAWIDEMLAKGDGICETTQGKYRLIEAK
jgi:hypothetical protein